MKKTKLKIEDFLGNKLDYQIIIIGGLQDDSADSWWPWWPTKPKPDVDNGPGPLATSGNGGGVLETP